VKDEDQKHVADKRTLKISDWSHISPIEKAATSPEDIQDVDQLLALLDTLNTNDGGTCRPKTILTPGASDGAQVHVTVTTPPAPDDEEMNEPRAEEECPTEDTTIRSEIERAKVLANNAQMSKTASPEPAQKDQASPLKRVRANTSTEPAGEDDTPSIITPENASAIAQQAACRVQQPNMRRDTKILRQGSNPTICSVALPAARTKADLPIKKASRQLSLFDTYRTGPGVLYSTEATCTTPVDKIHEHAPQSQQVLKSAAKVYPVATTRDGEYNSDEEMKADVSDFEEMTSRGPSLDGKGNALTEEDDNEPRIVGVNPTELHFTLEMWIKALGGAVTDVEPNGQCGWAALFAVMHNLYGETLSMTSKQIMEATIMKRKILNLLLAKLHFLVEARAIDLSMEPGALYSLSQDDVHEPTIDRLALYLDAERKRSVDVPVPQSCWCPPRSVPLQTEDKYKRMHE
ncbi:hypothetical protein PF002_g29555, partial [Phytophthora fragariae]